MPCGKAPQLKWLPHVACPAPPTCRVPRLAYCCSISSFSRTARSSPARSASRACISRCSSSASCRQGPFVCLMNPANSILSRVMCNPSGQRCCAGSTSQPGTTRCAACPARCAPAHTAASHPRPCGCVPGGGAGLLPSTVLHPPHCCSPRQLPLHLNRPPTGTAAAAAPAPAQAAGTQMMRMAGG